MNSNSVKQVKILNIKIDNVSTVELLQNIKYGGFLVTPNVDHLMKLQKDVDFYRIYTQADYIVCDSQILLWVSKFLGERIEQKISGSDFFPKFYWHYKNDESIKIFLLGGINEAAQQAQEKINTKINRQIVVGAYSPSMGFEKNSSECQKIVELINASGATVLAIGVGAPKQEKWIDKYRKNLPNVRIFMAIGATIDFEAGMTPRSPQWMSNVGLEWLYRLILEPRRLWKRYLLSSLPFFWLALLQKINRYQYKQPIKANKNYYLDKR